MSPRTLSCLALAAVLGTAAFVLPAAGADKPPADLIDDRPSLAVTTFETMLEAADWTWEMVKSGLSVIVPPSPTALTRSVSDEEKSELTKLLGIAGYKLKEIDTQVGVIPTIAFKFAMVRELSAADVDYLDSSLEDSKIRNPSLYTELQRTIVGTVMAINSGRDYLVSELKVQMLPLPKVAFSVSPKETALSEEGSALMRAIQKVDRRLMGAARRNAATVSVKAQQATIFGIDLGNGLLGGALALLAAGLALELRRHVDRAGKVSATAMPYVLFAAGSAAWMAWGHINGSWPVLIGGSLAAVLSLVLASQRQRRNAGPAASEADAATVPPPSGGALMEPAAVTASPARSA